MVCSLKLIQTIKIIIIDLNQIPLPLKNPPVLMIFPGCFAFTNNKGAFLRHQQIGWPIDD